MCRTLTAAGKCVYHLIYLRQIDVPQDIFIVNQNVYLNTRIRAKIRYKWTTCYLS